MPQAESSRAEAQSRVRSNAWSAGIAAALMLFYAFVGGGFAIPDKGAVYVTACKSFVFTLTAGGVVLALIAALCLAGVLQALFLDAVVSGLIGVVFILSGGVQLVFGDYMALLYCVFGILFLRSAVHNWRDYSWVSHVAGRGDVPAWQDAPPAPPRRSAGSELLERIRGPRVEAGAETRAEDRTPKRQVKPQTPEAPAEPAASPLPPPAEPEVPKSGAAQRASSGQDKPRASPPVQPRPKPGPTTPPPSGFLAALAKDDDEQQ